MAVGKAFAMPALAAASAGLEATLARFSETVAAVPAALVRTRIRAKAEEIRICCLPVAAVVEDPVAAFEALNAEIDAALACDMQSEPSDTPGCKP